METHQTRTKPDWSGGRQEERAPVRYTVRIGFESPLPAHDFDALRRPHRHSTQRDFPPQLQNIVGLYGQSLDLPQTPELSPLV